MKQHMMVYHATTTTTTTTTAYHGVTPTSIFKNKYLHGVTRINKYLHESTILMLQQASSWNKHLDQTSIFVKQLSSSNKYVDSIVHHAYMYACIYASMLMRLHNMHVWLIALCHDSFIYTDIHTGTTIQPDMTHVICDMTHSFVWYALCTPMGWLRLVGSLKFKVSFAEYSLFHRALLQKRPIIVRSLLILATPYNTLWHSPLQKLRPRNPPYWETQISRFLVKHFKLRFWFKLNLYRGIWDSWCCGFQGCGILSGNCHMSHDSFIHDMTHENRRYALCTLVNVYTCIVSINYTPHPLLARVLQCAAVCCSVLQCVAVCCSVLQGVAVYRPHPLLVPALEWPTQCATRVTACLE